MYPICLTPALSSAAEMRGYTNNPFSPGIERAMREDAEAADIRHERMEEREVRGKKAAVLWLLIFGVARHFRLCFLLS
jgi:hypothetical protein